jgi:hypothetical protein
MALSGPVVVQFGQDGPDEADHGVVVGEYADYVGPALDLFVDSLVGYLKLPAGTNS